MNGNRFAFIHIHKKAVADQTKPFKSSLREHWKKNFLRLKIWGRGRCLYVLVWRVRRYLGREGTEDWDHEQKGYQRHRMLCWRTAHRAHSRAPASTSLGGKLKKQNPCSHTLLMLWVSAGGLSVRICMKHYRGMSPKWYSNVTRQDSRGVKIYSIGFFECCPWDGPNLASLPDFSTFRLLSALFWNFKSKVSPSVHAYVH